MARASIDEGSRNPNVMASKETQPTTTATDPSDKPSPKVVETIGESGDVEDSHAEDPHAETKVVETAQPVHIDAVPGQPTEPQAGAEDDEEEEEEEPEDGPTAPKWRVRGLANFTSSKGTPPPKPQPKPKPKPT